MTAVDAARADGTRAAGRVGAGTGVDAIDDFQNDTFSVPNDDGTLTTIAAIIARCKELSSPPTSGQRLAEDLGITSFDMMVIVVEIEQAFGITVDFNIMTGILTVGDLARAIDVMKDANG